MCSQHHKETLAPVWSSWRHKRKICKTSSSHNTLRKHQTDFHLLACYEMQVLDLLIGESENLSARETVSISPFALHFIKAHQKIPVILEIQGKGNLTNTVLCQEWKWLRDWISAGFVNYWLGCFCLISCQDWKKLCHFTMMLQVVCFQFLRENWDPVPSAAAWFRQCFGASITLPQPQHHWQPDLLQSLKRETIWRQSHITEPKLLYHINSGVLKQKASLRHHFTFIFRALNTTDLTQAILYNFQANQ